MDYPYKQNKWAPPLLSVEEAAVLLGMSRDTLYRSIQRGDFPLPYFRINGPHAHPQACGDAHD